MWTHINFHWDALKAYFLHATCRWSFDMQRFTHTTCTLGCTYPCKVQVASRPKLSIIQLVGQKSSKVLWYRWYHDLQVTVGKGDHLIPLLSRGA